jgi:hypothetical protein
MSPITAIAAIAQAYATFPVDDGDQDGAGDRRTERRTEVGDAPREPRDLALQLPGEARLHDVRRGSKHRAHAEAERQQPAHERSDAVRATDEADQEHDPDEGDDEAGDDQRLLLEPLGEALGDEGRGEDAERRRGEDDARLDWPGASWQIIMVPRSFTRCRRSRPATSTSVLATPPTPCTDERPRRSRCARTSTGSWRAGAERWSLCSPAT